MPSLAHGQLVDGLDEVSTLLDADPTPIGGFSTEPDLTRAITRACVVILCSHLEHYLRSLNEEAVEILNGSQIDANSIPLLLRLRHSKIGIDDLADTQWDGRESKLIEYVKSDGWLWGDANQGPLDHTKLLRWMKSPKSQAILHLFRLWGFPDIFTTITRASHTRWQFLLKTDELVDKRNNIAHGQISTEATPLQVAEYIVVVDRICDRADRYLSRKISTLYDVDTNWY
ncbi:MAG: hypothetical protein IIA89_14195 [Chloroflexi bacterium]|nr:hypothetical protein [Chloroflexota bacterium]